MENNKKNPRAEALDIVMDVLERGLFMKRTEDKFATRLATGCIERAMELDWRIDRVAKPKVKRQHPVVRNVLRLGAYQLFYMDGVEDFAAINESVKLAKKRGQYKASGFVNAVLRSLAREGLRKIDDPSLRYSMPEWIAGLLRERFGRQQAEAIMEAFLQPPAIHYRTNRNGTTYIQDLSSQQVCVRAGISPGERVLDVCAAPGGKAIHAADIVGEKGSVLARDKSPEKVKRILENIEAVGFSNIRAQVRDALEFSEGDREAWDVVLADLPCSGLGVIKRKPDIKYRVKPEDIASLAGLQQDILRVVEQYVKPGGRLVFSTCTVTAAENDDNTRRFLREHENYSLLTREQLLPDETQDGFYIAVFQKQKG